MLLHALSICQYSPSEQLVILLQTHLLPSAQHREVLLCHPKDLFEHIRRQKLLSFMRPVDDVRLAFPDSWIRQNCERIKSLRTTSMFLGGTANSSVLPWL